MNDDINRSYYAIIPANVRYDNEITANAKLIYGEITALCNEKGYCWASNSYFADLYQVTTKSVSKWINQLIDKKYIYSELIFKENTKEIEKRHLYLGCNPTEEKFHTYGRKVPNATEEKFHTPMEEKVKDNNTIINNTINNKERKKEAKTYDEIINSYTSNLELKETIIEFIKMRKLIKSPMTDKAVKLMLNKLDKLSNNSDLLKIQILNNSIENGWKGIFELKESRGVSNGSVRTDSQGSKSSKYGDLSRFDY